MKSLICKAFLMVALLAVSLTAACGETAEATGDVVFAITDAAADMGEVSKIEVTMDALRVREEGGVWTNVSTETQTFDLLQLREMTTARLMAQARLQARNYDMVELNLSKVMVTNGSGAHEAYLVNNRLQMECTLEVQANTMTTASFDFLANESLHATTDGQYVFAPVIALQTRTRAEVQIRNNNEVDISGGTIRTNAEMGMNISGEMGEGLKLQAGAQLSISAGKVIETGGQGGNQSDGSPD